MMLQEIASKTYLLKMQKTLASVPEWFEFFT